MAHFGGNYYVKPLVDAREDCAAFRLATLPEYLEGRTPKEKHPFLFQKKFHPRQIRNARSVFLSGLPPSPRGGGGASSFVEVLRKMGSDFFKQTPFPN